MSKLPTFLPAYKKISMSDLNVDEKHITFAKFSEKHRLFLLLDMCDMKFNDRLLLEDAMIEMKINQLGKSLINLAMFETTSNANSMHQDKPFSLESIGLVDFEKGFTTYSKSKQVKSSNSAVETQCKSISSSNLNSKAVINAQMSTPPNPLPAVNGMFRTQKAILFPKMQVSRNEKLPTELCKNRGLPLPVTLMTLLILNSG